MTFLTAVKLERICDEQRGNKMYVCGQARFDTNTNGKGIRRKLICINCRDTERKMKRKMSLLTHTFFLVLKKILEYLRIFVIRFHFLFGTEKQDVINFVDVKMTKLDGLIFSTTNSKTNNSYLNAF